MSSFHSLSALSLSKTPVNFSKYKGKVVLVVNVASKCGFTPQYKGLEALHQKFKDQGLAVLGFPCNQFGAQEPGSNEEIASFCSRTYNVSFEMFDKVDVNGANTSPVYTFLKSQQPGDIRWNFGKFLVDKEGKVVKRFESRDTPESLEAHIKQLL
ncbi:hypothetical protein HK102_005220 [Quaeritorhiza haematococci]|nr:hypothetical protein HK102_005220 [Quaeritorhiza haematococci]